MKNWAAISVLLLSVACSCAPKPYVATDGSVKSTYIHQYGVEVADENEWQDRGSSGQIIKQLKNGSSITQCWQDGKLHGLSTISFPHTSIVQVEKFYDKGACVWFQTNYPSGMPKKQITYRSANHTLLSTWYEDGTPRSSEEYKDELLVGGDYFNREQELESQVVQGNGERMYRDGLGQLLSKDEIENGKRVLEIVYYPNGMPKKYLPYANDRVQGQVKTFLASGEPDTIEEWQNGQQSGQTVLFRGGLRIAVVSYVNGQKEGVEKRFRPGTDVVSEEVSWKNDLMHGPCSLFVDGKKVDEYFFQGQKVSRVEFAQAESGKKKFH